MVTETATPRQLVRVDRKYLSLGAAALLGAGLRLWQLGAASLWLDEAYTYYFVTLPFGRSVQALLDIGNHPPLYYFLSRLFAMLTASEFGLRLPAALAGIASIPLVYLLARRFTSPAAAQLAAWLMAVNPFAIWHARDARSNTLNLWLVTAAAWLFLGLYHRPSRRRWIVFVVVSALGYLTHYFSALFALACAVFLVARLRRDYLFFRWWTLAQFAALALAAPWFVLWLRHPVHSMGIAWIPQPHLSDLPLTLFNLATGWNDQWTLGAAISGTAWAVCIAASLAPPGRRVWSQPHALGLALIWIAAPLGAIFLFSLRRPLYVDRYFLILLPPLILLAASGAAALPARWRWSITFALLMGALMSYPAYAKEDWRAAAAFLRERLASSENAHLLDLQDLLPLAYYGVRVPRDQPAPDAFWTTARDARESAHRFSEYADVVTPPSVATWLAENGFKVVAAQDFSGLQVLQIARP